jgi:hypothetical protein
VVVAVAHITIRAHLAEVLVLLAVLAAEVAQVTRRQDQADLEQAVKVMREGVEEQEPALGAEAEAVVLEP